MCAEMHQWRAGDVRPAAKHSGRVRAFHSNVIAVLPPAGEIDGDGGNGRSARAMPTIARTRRGPSVRGRKTIASTGARTGAPTHNTARATVRLPGSANAIGGARRSPQRWQRWTRQRRGTPPPPGPIRPVPAGGKPHNKPDLDPFLAKT